MNVSVVVGRLFVSSIFSCRLNLSIVFLSGGNDRARRFRVSLVNLSTLVLDVVDSLGAGTVLGISSRESRGTESSVESGCSRVSLLSRVSRGSLRARNSFLALSSRLSNVAGRSSVTSLSCKTGSSSSSSSVASRSSRVSIPSGLSIRSLVSLNSRSSIETLLTLESRVSPLSFLSRLSRESRSSRESRGSRGTTDALLVLSRHSELSSVETRLSSHSEDSVSSGFSRLSNGTRRTRGTVVGAICAGTVVGLSLDEMTKGRRRVEDSLGGSSRHDHLLPRIVSVELELLHVPDGIIVESVDVIVENSNSDERSNDCDGTANGGDDCRHFG